MDQRSAAWFAMRAGKVTASRIADMLASTKNGWGAGRKNYLSQLVRERLTGFVEPSFCNAAMQWGIDTEAEAREAYQQHMLCTVEEVGFADHPTIPMAGCSPDGLVGEDGLVELKCPEPATHQEIILGGAFPDKYVQQALWQLACYPLRTWNDLVSYDPRWPEPMRLFIQRIPRDDERIAELERQVIAFLAEVDETVAKLLSRFGGETPLRSQLEASIAA